MHIQGPAHPTPIPLTRPRFTTGKRRINISFIKALTQIYTKMAEKERLERILIGSKHPEAIINSMRRNMPEGTEFEARQYAFEMIMEAQKACAEGRPYTKLITELDFADGSNKAWDVLERTRDTIPGNRLIFLDRDKMNNEEAEDYRSRIEQKAAQYVPAGAKVLVAYKFGAGKKEGNREISGEDMEIACSGDHNLPEEKIMVKGSCEDPHHDMPYIVLVPQKIGPETSREIEQLFNEKGISANIVTLGNVDGSRDIFTNYIKILKMFREQDVNGHIVVHDSDAESNFVQATSDCLSHIRYGGIVHETRGLYELHRCAELLA